MYYHWEDQGPGDDTSKCHPERNVSYALSPHILFCGDNQYIILSLSTSFNCFLWQDIKTLDSTIEGMDVHLKQW